MKLNIYFKLHKNNYQIETCTYWSFNTDLVIDRPRAVKQGQFLVNNNMIQRYKSLLDPAPSTGHNIRLDSTGLSSASFNIISCLLVRINVLTVNTSLVVQAASFCGEFKVSLWYLRYQPDSTRTEKQWVQQSIKISIDLWLPINPTLPPHTRFVTAAWSASHHIDPMKRAGLRHETPKLQGWKWMQHNPGLHTWL